MRNFRSIALSCVRHYEGNRQTVGAKFLNAEVRIVELAVGQAITERIANRCTDFFISFVAIENALPVFDSLCLRVLREDRSILVVAIMHRVILPAVLNAYRKLSAWRHLA